MKHFQVGFFQTVKLDISVSDYEQALWSILKYSELLTAIPSGQAKHQPNPHKFVDSYKTLQELEHTYPTIYCPGPHHLYLRDMLK